MRIRDSQIGGDNRLTGRASVRSHLGEVETVEIKEELMDNREDRLTGRATGLTVGSVA